MQPNKKTLVDIDGALKPVAATQPSKNVDTTFGIYRRKDGQLQMRSEIVGANENKKTLTVGDDLTPGIWAFIMRHPQVSQWPSRDYPAYKSLSAQTTVRSHPNPRGFTRPRATWKYKHMLRRMTGPGESIPEEEGSEDSIGDISESSPSILSTDSGILSAGMPPSPGHTRSYGKSRKTKDRGPFCYKGEGVVYLPGDITDSRRNYSYYPQSSLQVTPQSGTNWFMYWTHCLD